MPQTNSNLHRAKREKNDEFYTRYEDIKNEVQHYGDFFKGKSVYCNCDDYRFSNFVKYFKDNFDALQLRCLVATNYDIGDGAFLYINDGTNESVSPLDGNGDFRSDECVRMLKKCDIVCTNPAFSLWREYFKQLMDYNKMFLIIGDKNCITYKEIFPYIKENKLWVGVKPMSGSMWFPSPSGYESKHDKIINGVRMTPIACCWFTNIPNERRNKPLDLYCKYNPTDYPKYDNYDAIEVSKTCEIPEDYDGVMGVPITFLDKYCPELFEIIGLSGKGMDGGLWEGGNPDATINGKQTYKRILIRKKTHNE